jgi:hypothetical protein
MSGYFITATVGISLPSHAAAMALQTMNPEGIE